MSDSIFIDNTKANTLEFTVSAQGTNIDSMDVHFVIKTGQMDLSFLCGRLDDTKWMVKIPPISWLPPVAYGFFIYAIAEGYYYVILDGTINVTGEVKIAANLPKGEEGEQVKVITPVPMATENKKGPKSAKEIAEEIMKGTDLGQKAEDESKARAQHDASLVTADVTADEDEEEKPVKESAKDAKIKAILSEMKKPKVSEVTPTEKTSKLKKGKIVSS